MLLIHGGAFAVGSASDSCNMPSEVMNRAIAMGKPVVFVSIKYDNPLFLRRRLTRLSYRLGVLGFSAAPLHHDGGPPRDLDLNVGFLDQLMAMEWCVSSTTITQLTILQGQPRNPQLWRRPEQGHPRRRKRRSNVGRSSPALLASSLVPRSLYDLRGANILPRPHSHRSSDTSFAPAQQHVLLPLAIRRRGGLHELHRVSP